MASAKRAIQQVVTPKPRDITRVGQGKPGPGRKKGGHNKITNRRTELIEQILRSGKTPLEIMWRMSTGARKFNEQQFIAAKACAPYVHPRLAQLQVEGEIKVSHEHILKMLDSLPDTGDLGEEDMLQRVLDGLGEVDGEEVFPEDADEDEDEDDDD